MCSVLTIDIPRLNALEGDVLSTIIMRWDERL